MNGVYAFLLTSVAMSAAVLAVTTWQKLLPRTTSVKLRYGIWMILLVGFLIPFRPAIGDGLIRVRVPFGSVAPVIWVWGVVAALLLVLQAFRYARFVRMVGRWGVQVEDARTLSVFDSVRHSMGLDEEDVQIKTCSFISSSMLTGFIRPVILLPDKPLDEDELELVFKHELTHFQRHDLLVKLVVVVTTCIHWFNPIVHYMCKILQTEGEVSCDEAVLRGTDMEDRRFYGEVILGMVGRKAMVNTALTTCFYAGKSGMKRRLDFIMEPRHKKGKGAVLGVVMVVAMVALSGSIFTIQTSSAAPEPVSDATPAIEGTTPPIEGTVRPTDSSNGYDSEITSEEAERIALEKVGGGSVVRSKFDVDDGVWIFDISIVYGDKQHEVDVDAMTGAIVSYEFETVEPGRFDSPPATPAVEGAIPTELPPNRGAEVTKQEAKQIALDRVGGGSITKCETDYEDGGKVYEVTVKYQDNEHEMNIDAATGVIFEYDVEPIEWDDFFDD